MLSTSQAAKKLRVSPARVRKMIADDVMAAEKVGAAWSIPESEVVARLSAHPKAGRPKKGGVDTERRPCPELHELYTELKNGDFTRPSASALAMMDQDEAGFLLCVCDYFLALKQRKEIAEGVY